MLPVSLIFTSGVASGVNSYLAVLVLGLLGRFGHIAAIPPVLERPPVLAAAAALVSFAVFHPVPAAIAAAVVLAAGLALFALLASRIRRAWHRRRDARLVGGTSSSRRQITA